MRDHHHHHNHHHGHHHDHAHGVGHNHAHAGDHLTSHVHGDGERERREELQALAAAFVDGFRAAPDKNAWLRLAGIPFARTGADGLTMHLVDAAIVSNWQIGTASPAFASRELVYLPYPGAMVHERQTMNFTYVSLTERADIDLHALIADRARQGKEA